MGTISVVVALLCGVLLQAAPAFAASSPSIAAPSASSVATRSSRSTPSPARASATTSTDRQLSLGVSMINYDDPNVLGNFTEAMGGHSPAIWSVWSDWLGTDAAFPTALMQRLAADDILPMVIWEPADPRHQNQPIITYQKIIDGEFDGYIRQWAAAAAAYGQPMIVRFAHEMDGSWFPWSIGKFGNTDQGFIGAWRHIWNIFKGPYGEGAVNVRFLWSPFSPNEKMGEKDPQHRLYPGDSYVDYVGFTGFNWDDGVHPWASMRQIFAKPVLALGRIASKPIIAAETGTVNQRNANGDSRKPDWIASGYPDVFAAFPNLTAIVYFNVNMSKQRNWRLDVPEQAEGAYRALLSDPRFQGRMTWSIPKPPIVTRPIVKLATNVPAKDARVQVAWTATSGSPIYRYEIAESTGGDWTSVGFHALKSSSAIVSVDPAHVTRIRVRARDVYGRTSPWTVSSPLTVLTAQETSPAVALNGSFHVSKLRSAFGKSVEWSGTKGDFALFTFTGRAVGFVSTWGPDRGRAKIYLDGAAIGKINLYRRQLQSGEVVFGEPTSPGVHTLRVKVMGKGSGTGKRIDIDGFVVLQ